MLANLQVGVTREKIFHPSLCCFNVLTGFTAASATLVSASVLLGWFKDALTIRPFKLQGRWLTIIGGLEMAYFILSD